MVNQRTPKRRIGVPWLRTWILATAMAMACWADDDDDPRPPFDPGIGFEGILPDPILPPALVVDQGTSPFGVRQVFNTPQTIMGQSFTPTRGSLDWVGFVFQNNPQPNTVPGPGFLRARIYSGINRSDGTLSGLLGESDTAMIPAGTTAWLIFTFPESIPVSSGRRYHCQLHHVEGYPSWVGGRLQDFYPDGEAFGFLPNPFGGLPQDLQWQRYDLVFAQGTGRSPLGALLSDYVQWARARGLLRVAEEDDPDGDSLANWMEFFRDEDPNAAADPRTQVGRLGLPGNPGFLTFTVPTPVRANYTLASEGTAGFFGGFIRDEFLARQSLGDLRGDGLSLTMMESSPALGPSPCPRCTGIGHFCWDQPSGPPPRASLSIAFGWHRQTRVQVSPEGSLDGDRQSGRI